MIIITWNWKKALVVPLILLVNYYFYASNHFLDAL